MVREPLPFLRLLLLKLLLLLLWLLLLWLLSIHHHRIHLLLGSWLLAPSRRRLLSSISREEELRLLILESRASRKGVLVQPCEVRRAVYVADDIRQRLREHTGH